MLSSSMPKVELGHGHVSVSRNVAVEMTVLSQSINLLLERKCIFRILTHAEVVVTLRLGVSRTVWRS